MWRLTAIALAAMLGASAVVMSETSLDDATLVASSAPAAAELTQMRVCVGPARVTLGGEPFVGLAFGGDGCDHRNANLVGVRILRGSADADSPMRRAVRGAAELLGPDLRF